MTITNRAELDKCRESAEKQLNAYDCRILVCSGTGCIATGSEKIYKKMQPSLNNRVIISRKQNCHKFNFL